MKELLRQYKETIPLIFEKFGVEQGYGEIDDSTDVIFNYDTHQVTWIEHECLYSNEIRSIIGEYETYIMFYVDNGCGDQYYQIFDKTFFDADLVDE